VVDETDRSDPARRSEALLRFRARLIEREEAGLSPLACRSRMATRRRPIEPDPAIPDFRTAFQRDRDRILHSRAFRRLKHKTQVYIPFEGDHFRTRLTHTLEVSQIARTVARALGLNEDLTEACALGHDLGHTPFGHSGEKVLNAILTGGDEKLPIPPEVAAEVGGFKHNYQSVRIVDLLERRYETPGLNLTDETREGILKHTGWKKGFPFPLPEREGLRLDRACHLEGQVVAWADEIAQQAHDLEDGLAGIPVDSLREVEIVRRTGALGSEAGVPLDTPARSRLIRGIIARLATDLVEASAERMEAFLERSGISTPEEAQPRRDELSASTVSFSADGERCFLELKDFVYRRIIQAFPVARNDGRARLVVRGLFAAFAENPRLLPDYVLERAVEEQGGRFLREVPLPKVEEEIRERYRLHPGFLRLVADHLAGMTDSYALAEFGALTGAWPAGSEARGSY
jgi:dGTPase